jgi:hypothetical protein
MGGYSFLLPPHNMPNVASHGVKKLDPVDAAANFGTFCPGPRDDDTLAIQDFSHIMGVGGKPLGKGVITKVVYLAVTKSLTFITTSCSSAVFFNIFLMCLG